MLVVEYKDEKNYGEDVVMLTLKFKMLNFLEVHKKRYYLLNLISYKILFLLIKAKTSSVLNNQRSD